MAKRRKKKAKRRVKRKAKKKKRKAPRKPFGGMKICPDAKLGAVIGKACITPSQMTKKLWGYIKRRKLMKKK